MNFKSLSRVCTMLVLLYLVALSSSFSFIVVADDVDQERK